MDQQKSWDGQLIPFPSSITSLPAPNPQGANCQTLETDLLDDYITVSRNTSNTDLTNESYCLTHSLYDSFTMTHHCQSRNAV